MRGSSKKLQPTSVRLYEHQVKELQKLADHLGLEVPALHRIAIDGLLDYAKAHEGRLTLPLDFSTFFTDVSQMLEKINKPSESSNHNESAA